MFDLDQNLTLESFELYLSVVPSIEVHFLCQISAFSRNLSHRSKF